MTEGSGGGRSEVVGNNNNNTFSKEMERLVARTLKP